MTAKKPTTASRKRTRRARLAAVAAGTIAVAVLAAGALASAASIRTAQPVPQAATTATATELPMGPRSVTHGPAPTPAIGKPFLADFPNGGVAKVTVTSATMTSPNVLTLDVAWDSMAGATTPDPAVFKVVDGTDAQAAAHPLTEDALPAAPVQPGKPVRGKVAYDIPAGPATLVITPAGAAEATRITVK